MRTCAIRHGKYLSEQPKLEILLNFIQLIIYSVVRSFIISFI